MTTAAIDPGTSRAEASPSFMTKLNTVWHRRAMWIFFAIVIAHWAEHVVQAIQIWALDTPRPEARGLIGDLFPVLVKEEYLHYFYAVVMLIGFILLLPGMTGRARFWWKVALGIQIWHHFEHLLLFFQAVVLGHPLWGQKANTSVIQMVWPTHRVELHLFYNAVVFVPMLISMYFHIVPPEGETAAACTCSIPARHAAKHTAAAIA